MTNHKLIFCNYHINQMMLLDAQNNIIKLKYEQPNNNINNVYIVKIIKFLKQINGYFVEFYNKAGYIQNGFIKGAHIFHEYYNSNYSQILHKINKKNKQHIKPQSNKTYRNKYLPTNYYTIAQIIKDEQNSKKEKLSTFITLSYKFLKVKFFETSCISISHQITGEKRHILRTYIKEILNLLQLQHLHIKIRHTALNASQEELYNDLLYIIKQWNKMIMQMNIAANKQRIIHQSFNFLANILLSSNLWEIKNIITNNVETHNAIKKILTKHLPNETHKLSLFQKNIPIFNYYNLNQTINNIFSHKIPFLQNAYLIIDQTEACTVIDINSGNTRNTNNIEHNLYINQNAIPTIIQQIIIKNISGLIIIDFIEMNSETSIKTIENELTTQIKTNKIEAKISTMNEFGIITISRKRIYMNTNELFFNTCNQCNGQGAITNNNYNVYQALIHIENKLYNSDQQFTYIQIPSNIIHILLTHHRKRIDIIEKQYNKKIIFCN